MQNIILKNQAKEKLARIVKTAVLANFFNVHISRLGLKLHFATDPFSVLGNRKIFRRIKRPPSQCTGIEMAVGIFIMV